MTEIAPGLRVEGPVQAEVFVVWLAGDHLELTGPCGAAPWRIELGTTDHPVEVVTRIVRDALGEPMLVHSTSWRREAELPPAWRETLATYMPEPFRNLG